MTTNAATRKDIDDVLSVLDAMMSRIDERFSKNESHVDRLQRSIQHVQNQLDTIEKRLEISDDERLVMAHQLTLLHDWVEQAAGRIDLKFAH